MKSLKRFRRDVPMIYRRRGKQKSVYAIAFVLFAIYALALLLPVLMILMNSFKEALIYNEQLFAGEVFKLPEKWVFENFIRAFTEMKVPTAHGEIGLGGMAFNTLWMSLVPAFICTFTHLCTAYVCARYEFPGKKIIQALALGIMILPVFGTTATTLKIYMALGIYNQPLGMVLSAFEGFGMQFFILMAYFKGISWEYAEAVFVDGGGHFTVFFKIMLPQAVPISLVFFVQTFLSHYASYESLLLFMPDHVTIATGLYYLQMILPRLGETPVYFAALFLSAIPALVIYIAFGKTFMTSMNVGGLKG